MQDKDEDILYQGDTYEEEFEEFTNGKEEEESSKGDSNPKEVEEKKKSVHIPKITPKVIVIIAVIVFVLIIIISISIFISKQEEKRRLEQEKLAEELLEEEELFMYTLDEVEALRVNGYTGDEIEEYETQEIPADQLIDEATEARREKYEEEIVPYFDKSSKEFKKLYKNTWVGQPELNVDSDVEEYTYHVETLNVDYEKLPQRGNQLFIKFYMTKEHAGFWMVNPERWFELPDSGNIVLNISYIEDKNGSYVITNIEEIIP